MPLGYFTAVKGELSQGGRRWRWEALWSESGRHARSDCQPGSHWAWLPQVSDRAKRPSEPARPSRHLKEADLPLTVGELGPKWWDGLVSPEAVARVYHSSSRLATGHRARDRSCSSSRGTSPGQHWAFGQPEVGAENTRRPAGATSDTVLSLLFWPRFMFPGTPSNFNCSTDRPLRVLYAVP